MTIEDEALDRLIAGDAARLQSNAPHASPLQAWHSARANAAWRMARRLRWIGISLFALAVIAFSPTLLRAHSTIFWLLPLSAVLWPLFALTGAPRPQKRAPR